jgi:gp16 family phage-associated protein
MATVRRRRPPSGQRLQSSFTDGAHQATPPSARRPLSPGQIKRQLWLNGQTLKAWAAVNGYAYSTVSAVMSGKIKLSRDYGIGYDIACKLGLIVETENGIALRASQPEPIR